jgi:excisionase family DNA binding protein
MRNRNTNLSNDRKNAGAAAEGSLLPMKPLTVTVKRARQITGLGNTTIYEMIGDGSMESVKVRGKRLIIFASLERLVSLSGTVRILTKPATAAPTPKGAKRAQSSGHDPEVS